jgi:RNA polymerase sigma-70 factor, ECF subfamily
VVARVRAGDSARFEVLMRRYNARLFRVARAIVGDDDEAEDVVQEAYVRAWSKLEQFEGRASFATWLTRIAVHEALARARRRGREHTFAVGRADADEGGFAVNDDVRDAAPGPVEVASDHEVVALLQAAVDDLPDAHRLVFVLREVEGLSGAETAQALETTEGAVKVRLHRARAALRKALEARAAGAMKELYAFHATRCDRVVAAVFARILPGQEASASPRRG